MKNKKACKYCGSKTSGEICHYCKEKMAIITRIKAMLGLAEKHLIARSAQKGANQNEQIEA